MANNNLDLGFLFLYEWLPAFETLSLQEQKDLLSALINLQRYGTPMPSFKNEQMNIYAQMFKPVIERRLKGQNNAQKRWELDT